MPTVNELIYDRSVSHAIGLERYKSGAVQRIIDALDEADRRFIEILRPAVPGLLARQFTGTRAQLDRINERLTRLLAKRRELLKPVRQQMRREVFDFIGYELQFQRRLMEGSVAEVAGMDAAIALGLREGELKAARLRFSNTPIELRGQGVTFVERQRRFIQGDLERIRQGILAGVAGNTPQTEVIRRIRGKRLLGFTDGVLHKTRQAVEEHTRTAIAHAASIAREETWKRNRNLIEQYRIVAVLDGRTSDICISLSGQVFVVGMGPRPPFHHQCRTITVPLIKYREAADQITIRTVRDVRPDWKRELDFLAESKQIGKPVADIRRSWAKRVFGDAPLETTYPQWLKKQPRRFQDDVLGPSRGAAFRRGELDLKRFVDYRGRRLTLAQLRARDGIEIPRIKRQQPTRRH